MRRNSKLDIEFFAPTKSDDVIIFLQNLDVLEKKHCSTDADHFNFYKAISFLHRLRPRSYPEKLKGSQEVLLVYFSNFSS